jgi:ankyrin repeat protein
MSTFTVSQLKEKIVALGIVLPKKGSGKNGSILKKDLEDLYQSLTPANTYQEIIKRENPQFYEAVLPIIHQMPDLRGEYARRYMKKEVFDPWPRLYDELLAISKEDDEERKEDLEIMNALLDDLDSLEPYLDGEKSRRFTNSYPALTWILSRISPHSTTVPFLLNSGRYDLFHGSMKVRNNDVEYITSDFPTLEFVKKYSKVRITPDMLTINNNNNNNFNIVIWAIRYHPEIDFSYKNNYAIIMASLNGHTDVVKLLLTDPRVDPSAEYNYAIQVASFNGHIEVVEILLADPRVDPSANNNYAIQSASDNGHIEVVEILLADPRVDPSAHNNKAIRMASQYGHTDVVNLLLADNRVDPSANNNYAIRWASETGYTDVVRLLLADPRVDPTADDNYAIRYASRNGHTSVVKLLLADPRVDPSAEDNYAIRMASVNGNASIVKLLLAHPKVDPSAENNFVIRMASASGHTEVVNILLADPRVDPTERVTRRYDTRHPMAIPKS